MIQRAAPLFAVVGGASLVFASLLGACEVFSPLGYLTNGGPTNDAGGDDAPGANDGGGDAGPKLTPTVFADDQSVPDVVAVDDANVYWVDQGTSTLMSAPKSGGAPASLAKVAGGVSQLFVDAPAAGSIYWSTDKQIFAMPKGGAADAGASVYTTPVTAIDGFAVDASGYYVIESDDDTGATTLFRMDRTGANRVVVTDQDAPVAVQVDATSILWADSNTTTIRVAPKNADGGTTPMVIGDGTKDTISPDDQSTFAVDDQAIYWADSADQIVGRHLRLAGANGASLFSDPNSSATFEFVGFSVDATYVWWAEADGTIFRVPKAGGDVQVMTGPETGLSTIVSDGMTVYFTVQGATATGGQVLAIPAN